MQNKRSDLSDDFCNNKEILQGSPISPAPFKVHCKTVVREWSMQCKLMGLKIGKDCYIHNLLFRDDQQVITQGLEASNYMGRKIEEYEKTGLEINYRKMEYVSTKSSDESDINGKKTKLSKTSSI
jgi:hypothetical protein